MSYMRGNLSRRFTSSSPTPNSCLASQSCVIEVVSSNFREIVLDKTKVGRVTTAQTHIRINLHVISRDIFYQKARQENLDCKHSLLSQCSCPLGHSSDPKCGDTDKKGHSIITHNIALS